MTKVSLLLLMHAEYAILILLMNLVQVVWIHRLIIFVQNVLMLVHIIIQILIVVNISLQKYKLF